MGRAYTEPEIKVKYPSPDSRKWVISCQRDPDDEFAAWQTLHTDGESFSWRDDGERTTSTEVLYFAGYDEAKTFLDAYNFGREDSLRRILRWVGSA